MGYVYQADVYCNDCGQAIRADIRAEGLAPEDEMNHHSYDSDDYPKDANIEREEADTPLHCANCDQFLHNPLTRYGYQYVQDLLNNLPHLTSKLKLRDGGHPVLADWSVWYGFRYWTQKECAEDGRHNKAGWYSNESY